MTLPGQFVEANRRGSTALIRYANPPLHMIDNKGAAQIEEAVAAALEDPAIRAVILTGTDDVFIRHADVSQIARAGAALADGRIEPASFLAAPFARLTRLLDNARKPVIAAVNGTCMGGGLEIAIACTMRIAGTEVRSIGLPEIRIDIFPGCGGTQRLARLLGWQRARLFALRGEVVDAAGALSLGLVDEVHDDPLARAFELADELGHRSAPAMSAILDLTRSRDLDTGLDAELLLFAELLRDQPSVRARLAAFVRDDQRLDELP